MKPARKDSDLLIEAFGVKPDGIYVERLGQPVRGRRPGWLNWPSNTGADIAMDPPRPPTELAAASRRKR